MASSGRFEYTIAFKTDDKGLKDARKALQDLQQLKPSSPGMKGLEGELAAAKTRAAELETALTKAFNVKLGTTSVTALNKQLKSLDLKAIYKDMSAIGPKGEEAFNKVAAQALKTNIQIKESNKLMTKFGQTLWNNLSWMMSGGIIRGILGVFQQAYGFTKNLDQSLNNIRIVTGQSADEMERFAATAQDAAKELGKGTTDYTNAALIFYQQGLGDQEVKARTDVATKVANVSGQSIESAADEMTAVWNGYQVAAQDLELYADKLAAVASSTASNTQELAKSMSKVASAANVAGVDVDQLNAMLSTVISVTREAPESVGTAFKTIFARIGDLVEDGTDEFGVTLGQVSAHLHAMGIDILDEQGKMRDMGVVIEEVGNNWNHYSREQQEAIAVQMAGKRQYTQLIALLSNWDKYTAALETSQNAMGKLQEQQDIFMESIPAKLQQIRTSWEGIYDSVLSGDTIAKGADLISGLLEHVESFIDSIGGGLPMIQMFASVLLQTFSGQIGQQFGRMAQNMGIFEDRVRGAAAAEEVLVQFGQIEDNVVLQDIISKHEKILKYKDGMSQKQLAEYNQMVNTRIELESRLKDEKQQLKNAEELIEKYEKLKGQKMGTEGFPSGDFEGDLKDLREIMNPKNTQFKFSTEGIDPNDIKVKAQAFVQNMQDQIDALPLSIISKENLNREITELQNQMSQGILTADEIAQGANSIGGHVVDAARTAEEELSQIYQADSSNLQSKVQMDEAALDNEGARWEQFVQRIKVQSLVQAVSSAVGAFGQLATSIQMVSQLPSIISDKDLSTTEKFLKVIQNVGFTLPMVISSITSLGKVLHVQQTAQKIYNESLAASKANRAAEIAESKKTAATLRKEAAARWELYNATLAEARQKNGTIAGIVAEEKARELKTGAQQLETKAREADIAVMEAEQAMEKKGLLLKLAMGAAIFALVAIIGTVIYFVYKMVKAQEEAKKSGEAMLETADKLKTRYQELTTENQKLIKSFADYDKVWKQWQKGTAAVDEIHDAVTSFIETLGAMDDPEVQRALTLAEVTGNYDKVNELLQKRVADLKETNVNAKKALVEIAEIEASGNLEGKGKVKLGQMTDTATAFTTQDELKSWAGGDVNNAINISFGGQMQIDYDKLSATERLSLVQNSENIKAAMEEAWKRSQNETDELAKLYYKERYDVFYNLYDQITNGAIDGINAAKEDAKAAELGAELFNFDSESSQEQMWEKANEYRRQLAAEKATNAGLLLGVDVQVEDLVKWDDVFDQMQTDAPGAQENISRLEKYVDLVGEFQQQLDIYNNKHGNELKDTVISDDDVVEIGQRLADVGVELSALDISQLDDDTLKAIFKEKGELTEDTISKIKEQVAKMHKETVLMDMDLESLGSSMESIGEKIDKGISASTLAKNKDYQSIIEQTKKLKEIYPELEKDIDLISNPNLSGTQQFAEAWEKVQQAVKNAEIDNAFSKYEKQLEEFDKKTKNKFGKVNMYATLDADEFVEKMNELTAADYQIDVAVKASIENSVSEVKADIKDMVDTISKIGDNFIISAEDLDVFREKFPEILDGMTTLEDGSIQLSNTAVEKAKQSAQANIDLAVQEQVAKIRLQNELLKDKAKKYEKMIEIAENMNSQEYVGAQDFSQAITELDKNENEIKAINAKEAFIAEGNMADNNLEGWKQYYQQLSNADAAFWKQRLENSQKSSSEEVKPASITSGEESIFAGIGYVYDPITQKKHYYGDATKRAHEIGKKILEQYKPRLAQLQAEIASNEKFASSLEAYGKSAVANINKAGIATEKETKSTEKNTDAKEKNKDATDKQSTATAKLVDLLEDEIDAYHDINVAIQQVDTAMARLQKQQSKLTGQDLIDNLQKQNELLQKQNDNYEEKIRITNMDIELNRQRIKEQGGQFAKDGTLTNYSELLNAKMAEVNALKEHYNTLSAEEQQEFESVVKQAEDNYKNLKEYIKNYEQSLLHDLPDLEDKIKENIDKQVENNIKTWDLTIQVKLDTNEAEKQDREFRRKVIDKLNKDDIYGNALADYQDLSYFRNDKGTGTIQILTDELSQLNKAKQEIEAGGTSAIFGDNLAEVENRIKDIRSQLQQALIDEQEAIDNIREAYISMIDQAQEKWDEQIASYDKLSNLINHDMNVIKLLYGEDKSYAMLESYYQKQNDFNKQQLDMYTKQAEYWKEQMQQAEQGSEAWKKFKENWENAVEGGKAALEKSIQGIIDTYTNAINKIFKELDDKMTDGLGLERLKEDWDFMNRESERYLDSINGAYEISKLETDMKGKIDSTSDLATQQQLTATMNEQLNALKQKDKLTQYDLDRANALFDIEVKKAAFKDAQRNKSKMRLRRDSQGNYSYQFVSDEDSVAQAAQELADAQNSLYNLDKNAYQSNLNEIYDIYNEYISKMEALTLDKSISDEERERRRVELTEQYNNAIVDLTQQNEEIRTNLMDSTFKSLADMYGNTVDDYKNLGIPEQEALMQQTVSMWGSGFDKLVTKLGEQGLFGSMKETFEKLDEATEDYQQAIGDTAEVAGVSFEDIAAGEDLAVSAMEEMIPTNDIILEQWTTMIDKMADLATVVFATADGFNAITKNAMDALNGSRLYDEYQKQKAKEEAATNANKKVEKTMGKSESVNKGLDYGRDDWGKGLYPKVGDKVTYLGDIYFYDSLGTAPIGNRGEGQNKPVTVVKVAPESPFPIAVASNDSAYGWLKKYQIAKMDTGGYTGNWHSKEGKIGILHQKELVLNEYDTENFLKAMQIVANMVDKEKALFEMANKLQTFTSTFQDITKEYSLLVSAQKEKEKYNNLVQQAINISAQFPNVRDAKEIQIAMENLQNKITQYAYSTKR